MAGDSEDEDDNDEAIAKYASEWVESLNWDDLQSLSIFLWNMLLNMLEYQLLTDAAKFIAKVIGRCDRTLRQWQKIFITNKGSFPARQIPKGVLWQKKKGSESPCHNYVRENSFVKGKPNLTNSMFCKYVNEVLLPNKVLDPGFPCSVSIETSSKWLYFLGFSRKGHKKGTYVAGNGHEHHMCDYYIIKGLPLHLMNNVLLTSSVIQV